MSSVKARGKPQELINSSVMGLKEPEIMMKTGNTAISAARIRKACIAMRAGRWAWLTDLTWACVVALTITDPP